MTRKHKSGLVLIGILAWLAVPLRAQTSQPAHAAPHSEAPPSLTLSCASASGPSQTGVFYSDTCTASGGTTPYHFSISGTLPDGLGSGSTAASITISGTPTTPQSYEYTVTVTDSGPAAPQTSSQNFSGAVSTPVTLIATPSYLDFGTYQAGNSAPPSKGFSVTSSAGRVPVSFSTSLGGDCTGFALASSGSSTPASITVSVSPSGLAAGSHVCTITLTAAALQTSATVTASITVTSAPAPKLSVTCTPANGPVTAGVAYSATCTASGGYGSYNWTLSGTVPAGITLSSTTGNTVTVKGTPTAGGAYNYSVTASDSSIPVQTASQNFSGTVTAPSGLTLTCPAGGPVAAGVAYMAICTVSGGQGPYKWSITGTPPAGITLNSTTGSTATVSGTPTSSGSYSFSVSVTDSSAPTNLTSTFPYSGTISPNPGVLTLVCLPSGGPSVVGKAYSTTCTAYAGIPPYKWTTNGTLPKGLSLSATSGETVTISGIPATAGDYNYTLTLADNSSPLPISTSQAFTGTITESSSSTAALTISCLPSTGPVAIGQVYSTTCTASNGTAPYLWSIGGTLPAGLSATTNPNNTFTLSGRVTAEGAGPYSYVVQVVDSAPRSPETASKTFVGTIPALLTLGCRPATGPVAAGLTYSATCTAGGGTPPYNLSVTGTVPAGLSVSSTATTVSISGAPATAGSYNYSVTATDAATPTPQVASQLFTGVISGPGITTSSLPTATVGSKYTITLTVDGGASPYTWSVDPGTPLPQGLTLDPSTGVISGTPALPGSFSITVHVADNNHAAASLTLTLTVALPTAPAIDFSGLPATTNPAQQLSWTVTLGAGYPLPMNGTLVLKFTPASGLPNDPSILFDNGTTTVTFTIDKNATTATVPVNFQTGSVSGDIVVTVGQLTTAGQSLGSSVAGSHTTHVNAQAPVIKGVTLTRATGALTVTIVGYASSGQVTTANFQFSPASGANLQTTQVSVPVETTFNSWYQSTQASQYGSNFTYTQQFQVQGDPSTVASVTVTLANSQGTSAAVTAR